MLEFPFAVSFCRFAVALLLLFNALAGEARMAEPEATAVIGVCTILMV